MRQGDGRRAPDSAVCVITALTRVYLAESSVGSDVIFEYFFAGRLSSEDQCESITAIPTRESVCRRHDLPGWPSRYAPASALLRRTSQVAALSPLFARRPKRYPAPARSSLNPSVRSASAAISPIRPPPTPPPMRAKDLRKASRDMFEPIDPAAS
jgi:hypothetical protein